jgi:hypothetical protein
MKETKFLNRVQAVFSPYFINILAAIQAYTKKIELSGHLANYENNGM